MSVIIQYIEHHAVASPSRPAIILTDRVVTYGMVRSGIASVQCVLDDLKLEPLKPVGLLIDNPGRHMIIALALMKSGFAVASLRKDLLDAARCAGIETVIADAPLPFEPGRRAVFMDEKWFMRTEARVRPVSSLPDNRIVRVAFTSGSTGRPKAVAYSQRSLCARNLRLVWAGVGAEQRIMSAYGMSGPGFQQALQTLMTGRTICFAPVGDLLPHLTLFLADELRGSVGQIRHILGAQLAAGQPSTLKTVSAGGAYLDAGLASEIRDAFRCDVINPYSAVETGLIGLASGTLLAARPQRGNCFNIVADVQIVSESGEVVPQGAEGRIRVRSSGMAWPYQGELHESRDPEGDHWIYPGDLGRIDEGGLLVVTGRADEVINIGGAKFDPEVIEDLLRRHPGIGDIAVLRMIGEDGGHEAWAFVTGAQGVTCDDLNSWIAARAQGEALSMHITRVEPTNEIPRTAAGKVARNELRRRFVQ